MGEAAVGDLVVGSNLMDDLKSRQSPGCCMSGDSDIQESVTYETTWDYDKEDCSPAIKRHREGHVIVRLQTLVKGPESLYSIQHAI